MEPNLLIRRLIFALFLLTGFASATTRYVSPTGSGSCTQVSPCSPSTAINLTNPGDAVRYLAGTYGCQVTNRTGTSSARIRYVSDTPLAARIVCNGRQAWTNGTGANVRTGDYVDIINFEITASPTSAGCEGISQFGAFTLMQGNWIHDLLGNNAANCGTGGGGGIVFRNNGNPPTVAHDSIADSNIIDHIGVGDGGDGTKCPTIHGIYIASPRQTVTNTLISRACGYGIQMFHDTYQDVIAGVVVINNLNGSILVSAFDGFTNDYTSVIDSVVANNLGEGGIEERWGSTGSHNVYRNNSFWGNASTTGCSNPPSGVANCVYNFVNGARTVSGTQQSGSNSNFFVSYTGNAKTSNLQLKAGSPGILAGVNGPCAGTPGFTTCVPAADFLSNVWPVSGARDIGAYKFSSGGVPIANFSPSPLAFGTVPVSTSLTRQATLLNSGAANLTFSAATITGTNQALFKITSTTCVSPLPAGNSCIYNLTATPTAVGTFSANLTLNDNAAGSPHQLPLSVTGGAAAITITPASLSFGTVVPSAGGTSCSTIQSLTLTSSGSANLTVGLTTITDPNFQFGGTGTCSNGQSLTPGTSCTVSIKFCPTTGGNKSGNVSQASNAPTSPTLVPISGVGGSFAATFLPASFSYGNQQVGTASAPHAFVYLNTGTLPVTVTNVAASNASFTTSDNCPRAPATLAVGISCTVNGVFKPTATGLISGTITVTASANASTAVSGTGTSANLVLSPVSKNFGDVLTGTDSSTQAFSLTNTGTASAPIASVLTALPFILTHNCPAILLVNGTCTINVHAHPTATGLFTGAVTVTDGAPGSPHVAALSVNGVAPVFTLTPTSFDFGSQAVGSATAPRSFTLANTGTGSGTFTISMLGTNSGDFLLGANACTSPMPAGQNCLIPVSFKPTTSGARGPALLNVANSSAVTPVTSSLTGTGVVTSPALCLNTNSLTFPNTPVNSTSIVQSATVTSCGTASLIVSAVTPLLAAIDQYPSDIGGANCSPTITNIWCGVHDSGTPGTATGSSTLVTTPSVTGHARKYVTNTASSGGFRFSNNLGTLHLNPSSTVFTYDVRVRVDDATQASHFEFDWYQGLSNGNFLIYGVQCSFLSGKWEYTTALNPTTSQWTASNVSCSAATFPANTFIHLVFAYHRSGSTITYDSVTIDGVTSAFTAASGNSEFTPVFRPIGFGLVNFQIDGLAGATTTTAYLDSLQITGSTPSSPFTNTTTCATQAVGTTCKINGVFSPVLPGQQAGQFAVISNAASSPDIINLSGFGTQNGMTLSPTSLDFGNQNENTSSLPLTMTLTNTGTQTRTANPPTTSGANASDFTPGINCTTIAPGAKCTESVVFLPTTAGAETATFNQTFTDGLTSITAALTGTGVAVLPTVSLSPTDLNFGNVQQGSPSSLKTVQVLNTSATTLNLLSILPGGAFPADVAITSHCGATPIAIPAGNLCTFDVVVTPSTVGDETATAVVTTDAASSPDTVTIEVKGTAIPVPRILLSPSSLTFSPPSYTVNAAPSPAQVVTANNIGNSNLIISDVSLSGINASSFILAHNCGTVAPGLSCAATVNCKPTVAGSLVANLIFTDNDATVTQTVGLSCTGKNGKGKHRIGVSSINFNNQTVGTTSGPAVFTITNIGDGVLNVDSITASGNFSQTNTCGCCIAISDSCSVAVTFAPPTLCGQTDPNDPTVCISDVHLGSITVVDDGDDGPAVVALQGTAIPVPPPPGPITVTMGGNLKLGGNLKVGVQ